MICFLASNIQLSNFYTIDRSNVNLTYASQYYIDPIRNKERTLRDISKLNF